MLVVKKHIFRHIVQRILVLTIASASVLNIDSLLAAESLWIGAPQSKPYADSEPVKVTASKGNYQRLDSEILQQSFHDKESVITLAIPLPDGTLADFTLTPSNVMSSQLAERYPEFMSYEAVQVDEPANIGRFTITHKGLSGIFRQQGQWVLLSPLYENNDEEYVSYYYKDSTGESLLANTYDDSLIAAVSASDDTVAAVTTAEKSTGDSLITYSLALSATGEYTAAVGGTKADAVAEMVTLVARVNQILLVDTAIQFELIDNEDIIYTDADTDPYTNTDSSTDLATNQTIIDDAIGTDNYDIGHLLATNPGGLAYVGVVCNASYKAQGYSGNTSPQGERFYIDLVIHELGHQLDAEHSFNAEDTNDCTTDQRSSSRAVEPGSGSTIMSYAGLCSGQNIETANDPYFHASSVEDIRDYVEFGRGSTCGTTTSLANSSPSVSLTAASYSIPANTPFLLTAEASDSDGDELTYIWEEMDAGGDSGGTATGTEMSTDNGANPLFRSYEAVSDNYRYFPALTDVLEDTLSFGEVYPATDRELNFRVTVKDNLGGVNTADVTLDVIDTGDAFAVTQPSATSTWEGNTEETVTWDTASTDSSPISCDAVDITADLDGDNEFDTLLVSGTDNDGEALVDVPNTATSVARVMVSCSDNVFYAVNPAEFTIYEGADAVAPVIDGQVELSVDEDDSITITLDDLEVSDSDSSYPDNFTLTLQAGSDYTLDGNTVVPDADFYGELSVTATVNDGISDSNSYPLVITVNAVNDAPVIDGQVTLSLESDESLTLTLDDLSVTDPDSSYPDDFTLSVDSGTNYSLEGSATIVPDEDFDGDLSVPVSVNDGAADSDTYTLLISVTYVNHAPVANDDTETLSQDSEATLIDVLSNDTDSDDDTLSISNITYTGSSNVSISSDQISYEPEAGLSGTESISYTVSDGSLTDTGILTITIEATETTDTTDSSETSQSSSSSGGSVGFWGLALLSSMAMLRRRRRQGDES
jgi:hypothetical protein